MAKYRIGQRIGSGGFAEVLECSRIDDGASNLVMKRLLSRDPEYIKRFAREVRMQSTLSHPNVVLLRDELAQNAWARQFNRPYLLGAGLPKVVRDVLSIQDSV